MESTFSVVNKTKGRHPDLPFAKMKEKVLGKSYNLSLVFSDDALSKKLNYEYRGKSKPANVLSFPLSKTEGEIFINPKQVRRDAPRFGRSYESFFLFAFIHGLLHLKGLRHGSTMEKEERRYLSLFE